MLCLSAALLLAAPLPPNASLPSSVTRLRFVNASSHSDSDGRRRRLLPRRLAGWAGSLHGNLHTLGYFSADVCVGTPGRSFDLIVDTGSALTAFPCASCSHCGLHKHGSVNGARYSESQSSTNQKVACSKPPPGMHCRSCDGSACAYGVSYTEGSTIKGHMSRDKFWFGKSDGSRIGVDASFGCQTYESGMFNTQVADGITGWSMGRSYGPTLFDWFLQGTKAPDVFSMCLSETIGAMVLGGAVPAALPAGGQWIPYTGGSSYTVELVDIKLDGKSTGASSSNYRSTIVDSGTTFMYLPPTVRAPAPAATAATAAAAATSTSTAS